MTLDWLRQLLGLPEAFHGHIEDSASAGTLAALAAARGRGARPAGRRRSEHAHSSVAKAARILELDLRAVPVDDEYRLRPDRLDLDDACAVVATIGTDLAAAVDPVPEIADVAKRGNLAPRRRCLCGSAAVCPRAARRVRRVGARRLGRGQPAQVAR